MKKMHPKQKDKRPILFHIREKGDWSRNPELRLLAFASFDKEVADTVQSMYRNEIGQLPNNLNLTIRLNYLANHKPECFGCFIISTDLCTLESGFSGILEENSRPDICFHIFTTEQSFARLENGEMKLDYESTCREIKKTLCGCTTFLLPHYLQLEEQNEAPVSVSHFSISSQEKLLATTIEKAQKLTHSHKYGAAATEIASVLLKMRDTQCYEKMAKFAAKLMADGGVLFFKRASQEKEFTITLFEQAIHCYEAAIFYYSKLNQIPHTASCYANLANTRKTLLMSCEVSDSEIQQKHIVAEASAALIYYRSTDQAEIIAQLQGLISNFSPKKYPAKYFNILSDAEVVFNNYRFFPERVTIPSLLSTQILLERVIADLSKDDVDMRKQCHSSLVKVHYTLAMRTKSYESAQDHLSEALENLRLAELGTTKKSQDLLSAASHHMRGKVLLQYKKHKAEALSALGQAYAIYQQYGRQEVMDAITQIAPSITANEDQSSTNMSVCN